MGALFLLCCWILPDSLLSQGKHFFENNTVHSVNGYSFKKIIQHYCDLTGYLELPPKKALELTYRAQGNNGYLLPKPVYLGADDLDSLTTAFRAHGAYYGACRTPF